MTITTTHYINCTDKDKCNESCLALQLLTDSELGENIYMGSEFSAYNKNNTITILKRGYITEKPELCTLNIHINGSEEKNISTYIQNTVWHEITKRNARRPKQLPACFTRKNKV